MGGPCAAEEKAGEEIECWECHATQIIPARRSGARLARTCLDASREFSEVPVLLRFLAGGLAIATALVIPVVGPSWASSSWRSSRGVIPTSSVAAAGAVPLPHRARPGGLGVAGCPGAVLALALTAPVLLRHVLMDGYGLLLGWAAPASRRWRLYAGSRPPWRPC